MKKAHVWEGQAERNSGRHHRLNDGRVSRLSIINAKMRLSASALTLATVLLMSCCSGPASSPQPRSALSGNSASELANRTGSEGEMDASQPCVDLNTADVNQLTTLPGIGDGLAARIVEYRDQHGPFRRPQDIIIINGFGERRYHKLESFVCVH
jgi:competence ComEA-like helix-hairpin-helix protein